MFLKLFNMEHSRKPALTKNWPEHLLVNVPVENVCRVASIPDFTSQSATPSAVSFVGAKVLAIFSADQCLPIVDNEIRFVRCNLEAFHTKIGRAWVRNIKNVLLSIVQVALDEADPDGKYLIGERA